MICARMLTSVLYARVSLCAREFERGEFVCAEFYFVTGRVWIHPAASRRSLATYDDLHGRGNGTTSRRT